MDESYLLLFSALLIILSASLVNHYDFFLNKPSLSGEFCTDYSLLYPGCWCAQGNNKLYDFEINVSNALIAKGLMINYFKIMNESCNGLDCQELGQGFYNCYCGKELIGTISDTGEFYETECGI